MVSGAIMTGPIQLIRHSIKNINTDNIDWKPRQQSHERENIYETVVEIVHVFCMVDIIFIVINKSSERNDVVL